MIVSGPSELRASAVNGDRIARLGFALKHSSEGFDVYLGPGADFVMIGNHGVLIGDMFGNHGPPHRVTSLSSNEADAIYQTWGKRLLDRYWGLYVAILETETGLRIIRDPSGAMPCCFTQSGALIFFASDAPVLFNNGFKPPDIDWGGLTRHLCTAGLPSPRTALLGVKELLPGTAAVVERDTAEIEQIWSPWSHVRQSKHSPDNEAEALQRLIQSTTTALASRHPRALAGVSGGLDSSIIAACLTASPIELICATASTVEADGDERHFARHLCEALGAELIEETYAVSDVNIERATVPQLLRPTSRTQSQAYTAIIRRLVTERSIDAFYTGNGGDNVFAYSQSATSIYDRFKSEGASFGVLRTLFDVCALNGCSPLAALKGAARAARARTPRYDWRCTSLLLHPDIVDVEARAPIDHPWLEAPDDALPGKAVHIAMLLRIQQHLQASTGAIGVEVVTPLMAQPVIESCLAIPSWRWCAGGVNRSVARAAFSSRLPQSIIERRSKGSPDSFSSSVIEANRSGILERLRHGHLSDAGILDIAAIEAALIGDRQIKGQEHVELLTLLETEAWLDYWLGFSGDVGCGASASLRSSQCFRSD